MNTKDMTKRVKDDYESDITLIKNELESEYKEKIRELRDKLDIKSELISELRQKQRCLISHVKDKCL